MLAHAFSLSGSVAIVTGASKGIGRAIALTFAQAGASVVCSAREREGLDRVCAHIRALGQKALAVQGDVTDAKDRSFLVARAHEHFGYLTHLVNNVGGGGSNEPLAISAEAFTQTFDLNVTASFALAQLCVPHMQTHGLGNIMNISSVAAHYAQRHFTAYGTAKAALNQLTRLLAQEFAPTVRVNAIAPGPIMTDALAAVMDAQTASAMASNTPLKRLGTPDDIAQAALFLASPAASWITGKVLAVDGGAEHSVWVD